MDGMDDGHWVTVFGFSKELTGKALERLSKFGRITDHKIPTDTNSNWLHVRYYCQHHAKMAVDSQNAKLLTQTVLIGVKGGSRLSEEWYPSLPREPLNFCPLATPKTEPLIKTEQSQDFPIIQSVESLYKVAIYQQQDGGLSQEKGLSSPSPQLTTLRASGVEAESVVKTEKVNVNMNADNTIDHVNVDEEMESENDDPSDIVNQPVNAGDGSTENDTVTTDCITAQVEEIAERVIDSEERSGKMEETKERSGEGKMAMVQEEIVGERQDRSLSEVSKEEDVESADHGICNNVLHDQNNALQEKVQCLQEFCQHPSLGAVTANEDKTEQELGGISEENIDKLSCNDKEAEKKPTRKLCEDNISGRKRRNSKRIHEEFAQTGKLTKNKKVHTGEKPFSCNVCKRWFTTKSGLSYHEKTSHAIAEKPFLCDVCNKRFSVKSVLVRHKMTHTGEKPFLCDVCNKRFSGKTDLVRHKMTHTGEKPFSCNVCNMSFARPGTLKRHKRVHTGEKPFSCNVCNMSFAQTGNLKNHKRLHTGEKPFSCNVCNMSFAHTGTRKRHKRLHTGEKPFSCNVCNMSFAHTGNLKNHKRLHTGEKPFPCNVCKRRFTTKNSLTYHEKTSHVIAEKPFLCDVCNKRFLVKSALVRHQRTHTGEKPFLCETCGKRFSHKGNQESHMILHTEERTFKTNLVQVVRKRIH